MGRMSQPPTTVFTGRFRDSRTAGTCAGWARRAGLFVFAGLIALAAIETAAQDRAEKEWRQLDQTKGLSWTDVATVCPTDAASACSGAVGNTDLTHWVWANADQVFHFMAFYEPALLASKSRFVSGPEYFGSGISFLGIMRYTGFVSGYNFYSEWTRGLTSSLTDDDVPIHGTAGYGWWPPGGGLGLAPSGDVSERSQTGGVWLWRLVGPDYTPPLVTPDIVGIVGNFGWYVSDVEVSWNVEDPESRITAQLGCETASLTTDSPEAEFSCAATSEHATTSVSVVVMRDATAPTVICAMPITVFELWETGAQVTASVSDATSGPVIAVVSKAVDTSTSGSFAASVTGADRAGNNTTITCPYEVVVPLCAGQMPTIIGTSASEVINGTSGNDVILGLGGNDTIYANDGDDIVCAGNGNDLAYGGGGNDLIFGEAGNDDLNGGEGADNLDGGPGLDSIRGDGGHDICTSGEIRMSSCTPY